MHRIYVAGPYSADNVIDVLRNIGRGEKACAKLFKLGYAPFCPWHDKSYVTDNPDVEFSVEQFYEYSIAWLNVCRAMLVLPGYESSIGTSREINHAEAAGIPVYYDMQALVRDIKP